ncbi:MAG TPA: G1 family glutamic endopeptidase [Methanoregula sp.]|nr:G1 family glutamic endopeptidase [Methanoregula sp.]
MIDAGTNTVDVRFTHIEPSWAGYVAAEDVAERQPNVTSVRGSWRIPDLSGNPPEMATVFQWIGIGGFFPGDSHNLIQTGTASCIGGLCPVQYNYGWTELLPDNSEPIPWDFRVLPGDVMQAEIHEDSPGRWNVSLADLTQDWHYRKTVFYNSSRDSAEWILEKPTYAGEIHDLAGFVGAGFGTGTLSTGGNDATIGPVTGPAGSFPGFSVTMVRDNTSRAIPSNLSPEGGFTVHGFSGNGG